MLQIPGNIIFWVLLLVILLSVGTIFLSQNQILFAKAETLFSSLNRYSTEVLQKCSDDTIYNLCSPTQPKYCDNGILINNCFQCGCPSGTCQADGSCKISEDCDSQCKLQSFASGTCEAGTSGTGGFNPPLHVEGTHIVDAKGNIVTLRGVNFDSDQWWAAGTSLGAEQFTYMKNWGMNAVRINVQCYTLENNKAQYGSALGNSAFMTRLDNIISWATSAGLYVILNGFHTSTGPAGSNSNYPNNNLGYYMTHDWSWSEWVGIWNTYSTRYASYNNIIYELINEPLYCPLSTYQTEIRAAIDTIRTHNSNAAVVVQEVGTSSWDTMSFQFERSYPISRSNVIYSFHNYGYHFSSNSESTIRWKLGSNGAYTHYSDWMLANGRCVMATEFGGGYNSDTNYPWNSWQGTFIQNFMTVLDADGYSGYTAFRWVNGGWSAEKMLADWNGNPSDYGTVVKNYYFAHQGTSTGGGSTTGTCQLSETPIQDSCSSGYTCCCSGIAEGPILPPSTVPAVVPPAGPIVYVDGILGSLSGDGSSGSPFKTIPQGLSAVASSGGTVEVKDGRYQGPLIISDLANPVLIRVASGATPIIDCSKPLTGWQLHSGSIYKITPPELVAAVFYNGEFLQRARYPATGYLTVGANAPDKWTVPLQASEATTLASKGVGNTIVTVRVVDYWASTSVVDRLEGLNLKLATPTSPALARECSRYFLKPGCFLIYNANQGWGYYLENEIWMMNEGSWAYDFDANVLYVWLPDGKNPNDAEVHYSNPDDCIIINNAPELTVQGLTIKNSGGSGVVAKTEGAEGTRWNRVHMENIKFDGYELRAPFIIDESSVSKTGQDAVECWSNGKIIIESSRFTDIGTALGPRKSAAALRQDAWQDSGSVIRNNYLARISYIGTFVGRGTTLEGNTIEDFCLLFDDCAAIYSGWYDNGHKIRNNIIQHATANIEGKPRGAYAVSGIYLDDWTENMLVENNYVSDTDFGIFIHNARDNVIRNNKFVDFATGGLYLSGGAYMKRWPYNPATGWIEEQELIGTPAMANNLFEGNIIADTNGKPLIRHYDYRWPDDFDLSFTGNGNHYWNFFSPTILYSEKTGLTYDYEEFQATGLDSNPIRPAAGPFSGSPEQHIQGLVNIDYTQTTTIDCPFSGGLCSGWIDESQAQVAFPVTLAPRASKILWHL